MKKILTLALLLVLLPLSSFAAVDTAVVEGVVYGGSNASATAYTQFLDGGTTVQYYGPTFSIVGVTSTQALLEAAQTAIDSYAAGQGWTLARTIWPFLSPTQTQSMIDTSLAGIPTNSPLSFATSSRSLNSAFQVSATRASWVNYSVDISTTVSLSGGQVGTVYLEYADDSGFTSGVTEVGRFVNGQTGTLVVGLTLNQTNTAPVGGVIPAGKYVRLRTQNNTGTPTYTFRSGQEVLLASN